MYVCLQDLLVWLSYRPPQTKNSVHYRLPDVSLLYGVTQYTFPL